MPNKTPFNRVWGRFIAALHAGESKQYAVFLLLWNACLAIQNILRTTNVCFIVLLVIANLQGLAQANLKLILAYGFYCVLCYAIASLLLLLLTLGSQLLQELQKRDRNHPDSNGIPLVFTQIKRNYKLWFQPSLRGMLYILEIGLATIWGTLIYILNQIEGFSV